ncbi:unnamed protein product [Darwinula stevensoni]|uniref:Uncharacterized protein n=1 Tax=Darwinula stevensoni TaxID=69355 RepID=A0A7R8X396_9CRUS|nr:unnamed protein product [Darwinula stevensoni]CAG0884276.1 unnamed protein product [Darwinula stevensoni]
MHPRGRASCRHSRPPDVVGLSAPSTLGMGDSVNLESETKTADEDVFMEIASPKLKRLGSLKKQVVLNRGTRQDKIFLPSFSPPSLPLLTEPHLARLSCVCFPHEMEKSKYTQAPNEWIHSNVDIKDAYPDIRLQLNEQLRCLDTRLETQVGIVYELQDFFRRKAEVESEYSKALDKLSKTLLLKHKEQKQKREGWSLFSTSGCWKELVDSTRREGRDHAALADIYSTHLVQKLAAIADDLQRVYRRCREISYENHEEILKVLHELHTTMKTYQSYQAEFKSAENKLRVAQNQRLKLEQTIAPEKLQKSKKFRLIEKEIDKRKNKYNDARLKALKARNDYLLSMDAANASLHKYFVDDLSDIIDCMDLGFHQAVANAIGIHLAAEECIKQSKQLSIDGMSTCIGGFDSRLDKQKFLEANNQAFMIPKKFEFQGPKGDDPMQISVTDGVKEDVEGRFKQLCKRLTKLKTESEEIWKTLETAEKKLLEMVSEVDFNVQCQFVDSAEGKLTEAEAAKKRAQLLETEDFHLAKFRKYVLEGNLIARLEAKYELMRNALGNDLAEAVSKGQGHHLLASLPAKPRRKRIGRPLTVGQPKLFGGSLEEYLEATEEEIPLIMKSCIRVINLYGLHHQGVFRVSGSQVEIQHFKEAFERGEDPLVDISDASDINSVAGVLKLYLRQLREPLFPIVFFDQLMELAQLESKHEFVMRVRSMVQNLPRPVFVVMRYLFAFLNHLSEFSDENMMDPYNLAICFGPTLVPIPEDKDRIQFQNLGNELVKNIIIYNEDIFSNDGGIMYEKYISSSMPDEGDVGEAPDQSHEDLDSETYPSEDDAASKEKDISLQLFTKSEVLEAVAQFDFTARTPRELSFKKGETLTLYAQVSSDWWRGSSLGQDGLIPDKYILLKIRDEDRERVEPRAPCEDGVRRRASSSSDSVLSGQPGGNVQYASSETSEMPSSSSRSKSLEGSTDSLSLDESSLGPGGRRRSYEVLLTHV